MAESQVKKKNSLTRLIQAWGIALILGVAVSITAVDVIGTYHDFNLRSDQMRADYLGRQKQIIRDEVRRAVALISFERAQGEKLTRERIRKRVLEAHAVARYIYQRNRGGRSSAEIQQMIIDALRPVRFEHGSGYYFITRMNGTVMLNADRPDMEGLNYSSLKDRRSRDVCRNVLDIARSSDEGFYEYYWFKPKMKEKKYKKISFFKKFEPYDWIIGTGMYVDEIDNQIRKELLSTISRIRFGREGYIFINQFDGRALVSNGRVIQGCRKLWEVFNREPDRMQKLFNREHEAAMKPDGDYIYYTHIKLTDPDKESPKVSFIYGMPELKWLVGAGVYLDDVETDIAAMQSELNRQIRTKIVLFAAIAICIAAVFLFLLNRLNRKLQNDIALFMRFFNRAARSSEPIDRSRVQFLELDHIARYANRMIEDRRKTEGALRRSESKFRDLVEASSDLIWELRLEGFVLTYVSPQVEDILGYRPEEVAGRPVYELMAPEEVERSISVLREDVMSARPIRFFEHVLIHKDGSPVVVEMNGVPFFDDAGRIIGYRGVDRDITQRKQAEEELQKMQKLKSVGTLAGGIAHDFNNILTGVFGNIEIAKFKLSPEHEAFPFIERAWDALERATNLTKQLLTFARGGDPMLETVDLKKLVVTSVGFNLSGSNVKAHFTFPAGLWHIRADKGQIDQVIANLVINAKHAMPGGGNLYLEAENVEDIHEDHVPHLSGDFVKLAVRDEGVGISSRHVGRIFDPYFSTKQTGSGLGLATAHSIINRHGGHITVDSVPDEGTIFTIFLPAESLAEESTVSSSGSEGEESFSASARILVMDDEQMVCDVAAAMLEGCGYDYDFAADGKAALEKYSAARNEGRPFDIVIMDLTIPGGMGGREAAERLLEIDPDARIIVASGYSTDPIMANYSSYGFSGRLVKPFRLRDLKGVLKRVLRGNPAEPAGR